MFGIKTKVKIVKKYLQLMNVFHCLGFVCSYEKTHKSASLLQNFKYQRLYYMLPDVINGQAHCLYVRYA